MARWAGPGLIKIRDTFTGKWHEWLAVKCLPGVVAEANGRRVGRVTKAGMLSGRSTHAEGAGIA